MTSSINSVTSTMAIDIQTFVEKKIDEIKANKADHLSKEEILKILQEIHKHTIEMMVFAEEGILF